ncbi:MULTISPECIES: hypothetical protein [Nonomuraea]|uniref:Uncharacterized protein n=1 Tax=Nonomuraea africana TaxID=46171 RepID=A0ABR9KWZ1_9ACTN|nr:hypothetical protein [Nonomuraea africana]MBE1566559.1 hypothetical protein [Nonomuraea africana]
MAELIENFDDTTYVVPITGTWEWTSTSPRAGAGCFRSGTIGHSASTDATVTAPTGASKVKFWYRVSSEASYDFFRFLINGVEKTEVAAAGAVSWTESPEFPVAPGDTLTFRYSKDSSNATGEDAAFIDDLTFTVDGRPMLPRFTYAAAVARASRW